ncbi:MAG: M23 family metallopeptidase [Deltaproteobacteria bacterium]|nr:M23 family metallopeptidase [Deltaproteobacteria bacterium]
MPQNRKEDKHSPVVKVLPVEKPNRTYRIDGILPEQARDRSFGTTRPNRQAQKVPPLPATYLAAGAGDGPWQRYLGEVAAYLDSPARGDGPYLLRLRAAIDSERWMALSGKSRPLSDAVIDKMNDVMAGIDQRLSTSMSLGTYSFKNYDPYAMGGPPLSGPFVWPLERMHITSPFGFRRDPFLGTTKFHDGIDLSAVPGTIVHAAADGRVIHAGKKGLYGLAVILDHGDGHRTLYGHMETVLVHIGAYVRRGDPLGQVGSTGRSTGPHLHFSVYYRGRAIDPLEVLPGLLK